MDLFFFLNYLTFVNYFVFLFLPYEQIEQIKLKIWNQTIKILIHLKHNNVTTFHYIYILNVIFIQVKIVRGNFVGNLSWTLYSIHGDKLFSFCFRCLWDNSFSLVYPHLFYLCVSSNESGCMTFFLLSNSGIKLTTVRKSDK